MEGKENEKIKIGVIGCGGMGRVHIQNLSKMENVEVAYIADKDLKRIEVISKECRIPKYLNT